MELTTTYESNNYPVIVKHQAIDDLADYTAHYQHVFLFVDEQVESYWSSKIQAVNDKQSNKIFVLPSGEQVKTLNYYEQYIEVLLALQPTRQTCLVAIGGGAVGDFVGFLAATLLRGVDFIQVPTTILAHDSSIGGKVGINASFGKNLIGAFHRPAAVLYDLDFLTSLPTNEILSGYGEVYKHALLQGEASVQSLESTYHNQAALLELSHIEQYLIEGIRTKLEIVINDETERGQRQWLNLGHTFGHAVEYQTKIPHGHAVMIGILYQMIVANELLNAEHDIQHYVTYFNSMGYPLHIIEQLSFKPLCQLMQQDKKNNQSGIRMVLLQKVGQPIVQTIPVDILEEAFRTLTLIVKETVYHDNND
ncbi:3-dehydroquinate synthase [Staphylococcus americanisciuri]|uniref:3-dehydroquinate synthase n=1 Tax=Staphylococcus americanisciuri TaxID=2973940 RepID=A0ABT2F0W6_9STAP|nr:3-dehydroquinate synthase [Staphylococcus americanisciuri]MCS4485457.1 3-dehydroquinate synthase [Staphylococcus americanisciuri]